jgi:hypothetical protein
VFEPRYVYNLFQTCNTFLRANAILFAGEILGQFLDYEEKEVKPRVGACTIAFPV